MDAIVYTSNTGHTREYAQLLSGALRLPAYELGSEPAKGSTIIYLGWLKAGKIEGYKKASKKYNIAAVCAVGMYTTGTHTDEVRKGNSIPSQTPLFTLQGGIDLDALKGLHKFVINMLLKGLSDKKDKTEDDEQLLHLIESGGNYVCLDNLREFLTWYQDAQ